MKELIPEFLDLIDESYQTVSYKYKEVECLVSDNGDYQSIVPRGTEGDKFFSGSGWRDILRDARAFPWYDKRVGFAHAGFLKGARGLVDNYLVKYVDREKPTYLLGHSLGGALCICAYPMLVDAGFNIELIFTIGSPRAIFKKATKHFKNIQVLQYSNGGDPIVRVPHRFWGYRHVNEVLVGDPNAGFSIEQGHSTVAYRKALI